MSIKAPSFGSLGKLPRIALMHNNRASLRTGSDPIHMMKRFFLYRNVFGNAGGAPELGELGGMKPAGSLSGGMMKPGQANPGDVLALASARRMGLL